MVNVHHPPRPCVDFLADARQRYLAVPESEARTAAFALSSQARSALSLTGPFFDAAEFPIVTACSFASPRFDARISPYAGGWLPGSSGGLPDGTYTH
jgi:hypothetical protein